MQRVEGQPAFVLHAQAYRETSLLVDVFTPDHGRVGLLARGVRGARGQPLRALLQPLQPLLIGFTGGGELLRLTGCEAAASPLATHGDALMATFYLNELLLRLLPRHESQVTLFSRYAQCLTALEAQRDVAWQLRRFERDLFAELGYALQLDVEADASTAIDPVADYRYEPDVGAVRIPRADKRSISGASLQALAGESAPSAVQLRELRGLMRRLLLHRLGGRELRSWRLMADLATRIAAGAGDAER
jgi:DNA repair protein RecO (recombination protein O)